MVIDIHTHMQSRGAKYRSEEADAALRLARQSGVERIVYLFNLGTGGTDPAEEHIQASNDLGMQLVQEHPDVFISFCYLNPAHSPDFSLGEIERCIVDGPGKGIKLWISVHATDKRLDPIMERAAELDIPVLHHSWYKMTQYGYNESPPYEIANLARRHPHTKIIMAHLAGVGWRGIMDVKDCNNVYVDTAGAQPEASIVEYAVQELGAERVLFGSDWPLRDFAAQKGRVTGTSLSEREKELILGQNAARLLKLG